MKYAVYSAGSLGIVAAAFLAKANEKFDLLDRNAKSVEAINKNGAKVTGKIELCEKVNAILDSDVTEKYDIIFLYSKQINNIETIKKVSGFLTENGVICTMQNGMPESDVAAVLGEERAYGSAVGWGATRLDYGVSELTSEPTRECMTFSLGNLTGKRDEIFNEIRRILNCIGEVEVEENFVGARWAKLLINSAFSGMSAVCGDTFGGVAKDKKSRRVVQGIIKECIDVANGAGIEIEKIQGKDVVKLLDYSSAFKKKLSFAIIPIAIKKHAALKASMLQDIEKSIPCEIDSINGIVCRFGKKYNVPTPFNDKVVEIIKRIEKKELSPSFGNVSLFDAIK